MSTFVGLKESVISGQGSEGGRMKNEVNSSKTETEPVKGSKKDRKE